MSAVVHQSPEMAKSLTIVNMMVERLGVKLLAFDFDMTLLDIDTGGNKQTPEELARSNLRPCFRAIIAAGFKAGLQMCVVSYNHRKDLIAGVLKSAFPTVLVFLIRIKPTFLISPNSSKLAYLLMNQLIGETTEN